MKKLFSDFQLSKSELNDLRGGAMQICRCSINGQEFMLYYETYEELESEMFKLCGDEIAWTCSKA